MQDDENNYSSKRSKMMLTRRIELNFWRTCLLNACGLLIADLTTSQVAFDNAISFGLLVIMIWFLNWILKPILVVFALPFIIFTVGIGMLFINALIIYFAARLIPGDGIVVDSYWSALWASFWVSVLSWGLALAKSEKLNPKNLSPKTKQKKDDDVIDV